MPCKLYRVIQPVTDIEQAAAFYSSVLGEPGERVSAGRHYFNCDGLILACYDAVADGDEPGDGWRHHENQYLYFSVDDIYATLDRVKDAGGEVLSAIEDMPWGEKLFYARDPFSNPLSFVAGNTLFLGSS